MNGGLTDPSRRPRAGAARVSAVIELEGPYQRVFEEGSLLLRLILDELACAEAVSVRVDYGEGSTREDILEDAPAGPPPLIDQATDQKPERCFWTLAMEACQVISASGRNDKDRVS